jgi:nickel-dependent lactate racemase
MIYYQNGSENTEFSADQLKQALTEIFEKLGKRDKVIAVPPDYTRYHSFAGQLTAITYNHYRKKLTDILPALGTHSAMADQQIDHMFSGVPKELFRVHDWRNDITTLGEVPAEFINQVSDGKVNYSWPAQVNKLLISGGHDLILSIGQVVPHEVIGMANYNKNIFVGTGGPEGINKSHFLGAVWGMERIMGRADNPVRQVLNYASDHFAKEMPVVYLLTVVGKNNQNKLVVRGLYAGDDVRCFELAAELSLKVNFQMMGKPLNKVIVYLDPSEFKSTWLGNKSVYRTRMAIADGGELVVLAPGLKEFGEDRQIDALIRKYGYLTTPEILELTNKNKDLKENLSAAAHLIHGSAENRFTITYCPGFLTKKEIESVNYRYKDIKSAIKKYNPQNLKDGFNKLPDGEEIYFIANPALGLWAYKGSFA